MAPLCFSLVGASPFRKVFQEISRQLILRTPNPAEAFLMLACTCRMFYTWAQQYDHLWQLAHLRQFGTLEEQVEKAFKDHGMSWRSLVLARLRILRSPTLQIASWLAQGYKANLGVKYVSMRRMACFGGLRSAYSYSEAQLLTDADADGVGTCTSTLLAEAFSTLISFYTFQIQDLTGNEEDYFDSQIHKFKLSVHGRGPPERGRYYGVERCGSLPPPFPKKATPTSVFTITIAALNPKSPQSRALPYFNGILSSIHRGLARLVHATFDASVAVVPEDRTVPKQLPRIKHVLLPSFFGDQGPNLGELCLYRLCASSVLMQFPETFLSHSLV